MSEEIKLSEMFISKYERLHLVSMTTEVLFTSPVCLSRLKKDLKGLLFVHPAWYIRALLTVVKPFIRSATHPLDPFI